MAFQKPNLGRILGTGAKPGPAGDPYEERTLRRGIRLAAVVARERLAGARIGASTGGQDAAAVVSGSRRPRWPRPGWVPTTLPSRPPRRRLRRRRRPRSWPRRRPLPRPRRPVARRRCGSSAGWTTTGRSSSSRPGPPDARVTVRCPDAFRTLEIWTYLEHPTLGKNARILFYPETPTGLVPLLDGPRGRGAFSSRRRRRRRRSPTSRRTRRLRGRRSSSCRPSRHHAPPGRQQRRPRRAGRARGGARRYRRPARRRRRPRRSSSRTSRSPGRSARS